MKEIETIEQIKDWFADRTMGEIVLICSALGVLIGLTGGYLLGVHQESAKITHQLEEHAISGAINEANCFYSCFSIDGVHIYYLVKTNTTVEDYVKENQ